MMTLPLSDLVDLMSSLLGLLVLMLGYGFGLSAGFLQFSRQRGCWGPTPTHKPGPPRLSIVDLDDMLLRGRLAVCHVALLAGTRTLTLPAHVSHTERRIGGILQVGERNTTVCHNVCELGRRRDSYRCHSLQCCGVGGVVEEGSGGGAGGQFPRAASSSDATKTGHGTSNL
jgi:hypothetical protein